MQGLTRSPSLPPQSGFTLCPLGRFTGLLGQALFLLGQALFTFGCNSVRHLVGGGLDCFTCSASARARHKAWLGVSVLNRWHMQWAWISLVWVALTDLYIRLAAAGVFDDPKII